MFIVTFCYLYYYLKFLNLCLACYVLSGYVSIGLFISMYLYISLPFLFCIDIHVLRIICFLVFSITLLSLVLSESNQSIALHMVYFRVKFSVIFFIVIRKEDRTAVKIEWTLT